MRIGTRSSLWMMVLLTATAATRLLAGPAAAQGIIAGGLTGQPLTRAATVGSASDVVFLTVPAGHFFVMTQICWLNGPGSNFRLNGVGDADGNQGGAQIDPQATLDFTDCKTFTPGLVYQPGDAVKFRNNGPDLTRVYMNGVLIR